MYHFADSKGTKKDLADTSTGEQPYCDQSQAWLRKEEGRVKDYS